jgi:peptidoglycan/xylan/chitin deacetylase (PgdA/CDA1 family)
MQSYRAVLWVVISTTCIAIVACLTIPSRTLAASTEITKWKNNMSGAASLTFDDGYLAQYTIGVTALNAFGFKGTFFLVTRDTSLGLPRFASWDNWRSAASSGHEIGSHTETHPQLSTLADAEMRIEILYSQAEIEDQIDSQNCLTFAYPYGDLNSNAEAIVASAYIGARGVPPGLNSFPFDFYNAYVWFPESVNGSLEYQADLAETLGEWLIVGFHGMDGTEYGPVTEERFRQFLNHIRSKNLWVDTFGAVTRYIRERESASLYVVSSSSNGMVLNLSDSLDDIVYDEELTIRSEVPSNCVSALVTQGGTLTTANSVLEGSTKVIYFNAIPDRGEITVTFITGPIALSALSVSPAIVVGGFSAYGTVMVSGAAPSGGVAVSLSDNSTAASVPANVTVPAGSSSATFEVTTSAVNSSTSVSISAAYDGVTLTATLTVTPVPLFLSNSGGGTYTDGQGQVYGADQNFSGGNVWAVGNAIDGTVDDLLYQSEIYYEAAGERVFDVWMEDQKVIANLDIYSQVGKNRAYDVVLPVSVVDGVLNIQFSKIVDLPKLSAVVVSADDPNSDIDRDGDVDGTDLALLIQAYGSDKNDLNFEPLCDFVFDWMVNERDLEAWAPFFGHTGCPCQM